MTYDPSKKISVSYNPLNLPRLVEFDNSDFIEYTYTATGTKLRKTITSWKTTTGGTTDYAGQFLYQDNELSCIFTPVGRIVPMQYNDETFWKHEYNLKDHLGNTRIVFAAHPHGQPEVMQQTSYYPFGMTLQQQNFGGANNPPNKLLYNGKELQDDELAGLSLDWYDYGARMYDAVLGRWHVVDPLAEQMPSMSPYCYAANNPIRLIDIDGLAPGDPPGPGNYQASIISRYVGFGLRNPVAATRIGFGVTPGATNISTNATRFATRGEVLYGSKRSQEDRGSENGAFRHGLWQATITSEFGGSVAAQAGNAHEENAFTDLSIRSFSNVDEADQTVDLLNNVIGRSIGAANQGANMNELANLVLDEFKNNGLYTATKDKDGNWVVSKTTLSSEKYNQLKEIFKGLNENGRTAAEQQKVDAEAQKRLEELQQTWGTMK